MNKNDHVSATCTGYTHDGSGVVKIDGFPLFVKGMCRNEIGEIVVTKMKKTYGFGRLLHIVKKSAARVVPPCPIATQCGGCQLQHLSYQEQLLFKKQKVQDVMQRVAHLELDVRDVIGMADTLYYRNKGQIPIGYCNGHVVTGFYRINSNTIVDTDTCRIQSTRINQVLQTMRSLFLRYDVAHYFRHILIKDGFVSGQVMVVWITKQKRFPKQQEMCQELCRAHAFIKSVIVNVNTREDNVILGDKEYVLYGTPYIMDSIAGMKFHISANSFYQVNPQQTKRLYENVLAFCALEGKETVLDLYCGVGTISMFLATKAKKVIGVEIVEEAIADARQNAMLNGLENIEFVCSDAASYAAGVIQEELYPDIIVVDPPRKGCDGITLASIVRMQPKRIVYVSCDPSTLARDLKVLHAACYQVDIVQPVDMFPYSFHVESVVLLQRRTM